MIPNLYMDAIANLMRSTSNAEILPRFLRSSKGGMSANELAAALVVEGQHASEHCLRNGLMSLLPDALFVGKKAMGDDPDILTKLAGAELSLVVDPLDGTFNFVAGMPLFGVMVAVVFKGETIAGLIFDPNSNDCIIAEKGAGAFRILPDGSGERLAVKAPASLGDMDGLAWLGYLPLAEKKEILGNLHKLRFVTSYRCAAHEYRTFAGGYVDFLMHYKLLPLDHLAGTLISQEAGAYAARFDGSPYRPTNVDGGLLIATDKDSWEMLRREVFTV